MMQGVQHVPPGGFFSILPDTLEDRAQGDRARSGWFIDLGISAWVPSKSQIEVVGHTIHGLHLAIHHHALKQYSECIDLRLATGTRLKRRWQMPIKVEVLFANGDRVSARPLFIPLCEFGRTQDVCGPQ